MNAATIAPAPALIAEQARLTLARVLAFEADWPESGRPVLIGAAIDLDHALDVYRILSGLPSVRPDATEGAAMEAALAAGLLLTAVSACWGPRVADEMNAMTARGE